MCRRITAIREARSAAQAVREREACWPPLVDLVLLDFQDPSGYRSGSPDRTYDLVFDVLRMSGTKLGRSVPTTFRPTSVGTFP